MPALSSTSDFQNFTLVSVAIRVYRNLWESARIRIYSFNFRKL